MNEKSKIFVLVGAVVIIAAIVFINELLFINKSGKIYDAFNNDFKSETKEKIVFIGRSGCSWCQLFRPIFDYYAEKYEISYNYIDTDKITRKDLTKILNNLGVEESNFGTPLVAFVKAGEATEVINGYTDESKLLDILKKHGFVSDKEKASLNYLDFDSLKKTISSKEKSVIVFGQTYCSYCIKFKPVLMKIIDDNKIKINYINYNEVEDQDSLEEYVSKFEPFNEDWGTPLTIIFEKGSVVDSFGGYADEATYLSFLRDNGILN